MKCPASGQRCKCGTPGNIPPCPPEAERGPIKPVSGRLLYPAPEVKERPTETALRYTGGKRRVDLVPPDAILALADLMTVNGHKYPDRNWEKGMDYSMILGSMERHMLELKSGVDIDHTDNQHHAIKVMWNAMVLYCYWNRKVGNDDRPSIPMPEPRPLPEGAAAIVAKEEAKTYG